MTFDTPLSAIATIKPLQAAKLKKLGLENIRDLLYHFPHRYEDFSHIRPIAEIAEGEKCTVMGTVTGIYAGHTWKKKMFLTEVDLRDESGTLRLIWFNQRYVSQMLAEGATIRVSGKVTQDKKGLIMTNPAFEKAGRDATHTARLVPVYPETAGLTSKFFRWQLATIIQKITDFPDPIPEDILKRLPLPSLRQALIAIHFPKNEEQALVARKRFAFEEMFFVQLKTLQLRLLFQSAQAPPLPLDADRAKHFTETLPFELTGAQAKAVHDILADLRESRPMNRLLNGDVGSGKTVVAALAALAASANGKQAALLAPTEVLARQHYESFLKFFGETEHEPALLTASYHFLSGEEVSKATLQKAIRSGIPRIIIGTHALLQEKVRFQALALVIVDEQHRFGVAQRARLQEASLGASDGDSETVPHFLAMTATPIPRTLALAFFGDLAISVLDEMPKNRLPIITKVAASDESKAQVYQFVRQEIRGGRQAFVIFPLVEESLALKDVKAAVAEHRKLEEEIFPGLAVGLLHGRLKAAEKEQVMKDFKEKKYHILVATAVVEVGIDVSNASVIIIEEAERFGLAQLHQFRGRVGRGEHQSYCFLFTGKGAQQTKRLKVLSENTSGFAIAEADLEIRGPGAFFGTRQSGLPDIALENLMNMKLVTIARDEAKNVLNADPLLKKHPLLQSEIDKLDMHLHME